MALAIVTTGILAFTYLRQADQPTAPAAQPKRWTPLAAPQQSRRDFALVAHNDYLYLIGGTSTSGPTDAVERYDPNNDVWVPLSNKPTAATNVQAVTLGGRIYVPGGESKDGKVLDVLESYDPRTERWEQMPAMPAPRSQYALSAVEGRLILFGGWDGSSERGEVFIYDPATEHWSEHKPLPTPRRNAGAALINGFVYVVGGENAQGALRVNERFDPTVDEQGQPWTTVIPMLSSINRPIVAGVANLMIVFSSEDHQAAQYSPTTEAWIAFGVPEEIEPLVGGVPVGTSIFVLGDPSSTGGRMPFYQYQALYTSYLPQTS